MNNVRAVQVKQFNEANHTIATDFLYTIIRKEHLLSQYPSNPIAFVEAPKTAIYCTTYFGSPENPKNPVGW